MTRTPQDWYDALAHTDALAKVFVVGTAKSGTTWVQMLLNAHPAIVMDGEGGFVWRALPLVQQAARVHNAECAKHGHPEHVQISEEEFALHFRHFVLSKLSLYIDRSGRDRASLRAVGDKTPQHALGMIVLAQLFAGARFVHVVRDPRDGAVSAWHHFGAAEGRTLEEHVRWYITESWKTTVEHAIASEAQLGESLLHVRYEDLRADATATARRLFAHTGVPARDDEVDACIEATRFEVVSGGRKAGDGDNAHFFRKGIVGDWRSSLDHDAVRSVCREVAPLMQRFGYDPDE